LNYDYVSDEENGVGVDKGKWVVRRPIWRSERASVLMEWLQEHINNSQREDLRPHVPRVVGVPSARQMPASLQQEVNTQWRSWRRWKRMKGATTPQPLNSIQHQSLLCIEVIKASVEGNIDMQHALLEDRGVPSKVTLNSLENVNSSKKT